jgi:hypothetical protein
MTTNTLRHYYTTANATIFENATYELFDFVTERDNDNKKSYAGK